MSHKSPGNFPVPAIPTRSRFPLLGCCSPGPPRSPGPRGASTMTDGGPHSPTTEPQTEIPLQAPNSSTRLEHGMSQLRCYLLGKRDPGRGCGDTDLGSPRSRAGKEQQEKDESALRAGSHLAQNSLAAEEGRSLFPDGH